MRLSRGAASPEEENVGTILNDDSRGGYKYAGAHNTVLHCCTTATRELWPQSSNLIVAFVNDLYIHVNKYIRHRVNGGPYRIQFHSMWTAIVLLSCVWQRRRSGRRKTRMQSLEDELNWIGNNLIEYYKTINKRGFNNIKYNNLIEEYFGMNVKYLVKSFLFLSHHPRRI